MDQQNDNNALRQSIQDLERRIGEKDDLLRQQASESRRQLDAETTLRIQKASESRRQLDAETALRIQKEGELSAHIKTKEQQVWKTWESHENEKTEIRKAHAREIALHQDKGEALCQVQQLQFQQLQAQQLQTKKELEHCQERGTRAEKERGEMFKKVGEMKLTIFEAEKEIAALEKKKDEALMQSDSFEKEKDEALRKLQSSSMLDFFVQCQTSLSSKLVSDPDPFQRNPKTATKMINRFKPLKLHRFLSCEQEQRAVFDELCKVFPPDLLVFTRLITVIEIGEMIESIASESKLQKFLWAYVERFAKQVFSKLASADKTSKVCKVFGEITVIDYARNLDDSIGTTSLPGEVPGAATTSTQAQDPVPDSADPKEKAEKDKVFKPDGLYVCIKPGEGRGRNVLLFPIEIKPGYAVTRQLVALLKATDTFGEAKPGQPPQPGMNLFYGALMQIYDYMVASLSSYGMLTTGEVIIFLYIDWSSDATTLYYHP
ncbi:uncharacterized protein CPUR_02871 [Claviceps purpurea 20.1]|uniref:Uncharacterized protein n=1 Tax=Claviceps purpurea (strain 20.1) TaxID=1111077 RepID=M1W4A6_CLAP2|nr:uncharacterized protein CPUR_02871 [Claviceps purpurea 20.1]